jgi:hypothetical protein
VTTLVDDREAREARETECSQRCLADEVWHARCTNRCIAFRDGEHHERAALGE